LGSCLPDNASSTRQNRNSAQIRVFSHARLHFVAARVRQPSGGKAPPRKLSARANAGSPARYGENRVLGR